MTQKEAALVLFSLGNALTQAAEDIAKHAAEEKPADTPAAVPEKEEESAASEADDAKEEAPAKEIHLEDVRAVLSDISRSGHTAEMKALLAKHGAKKLSDIPKEEYAQVLAEAEEVKNA